MEMTQKTAHGHFVWFDLVTPNVEEALDFYAAVTGWGTEEWAGSGEGPYTMITADGQSIGGVNPIPSEEDVSSHWLSYVACDDLDAARDLAGDLGASIASGVEELPEVGRMVSVTDPTDAAFSLYEPTETWAVDDEMAPVGHFSWHELTTTDVERAKVFYTDLFGWTEAGVHEMGDAMGTYWMFGAGERAIGGMYQMPADMPGPSNWLHYIRVPDVDAALDAVRRGGGEVVNGPMEVPGGDLVAQCVDPFGAHFAVHASTASD